MRLRERVFPSWLWRLPPGSGKIALTFDDGPHPESTAQFLGVLGRLQIPSTMFVIGEQCTACQDVLRDAVSAGHCLALHGYRHESFLWRSRRWQQESIVRTANALRASGVAYQPLFRPPYGHFNLGTGQVLSQLGLTGVMWSQLTVDWKVRDPEHVSKEIIENLREGNIIVLHDHPATIGNVLHVLPLLAEEVARRGWTFATLPHPIDPSRPAS